MSIICTCGNSGKTTGFACNGSPGCPFNSTDGMPAPKIKTWAERLAEEQAKQSGKIIISSSALYKFLSERMEFWKEEVKIVGTGEELIIDGFKGLMCNCKAPFETSIYVDKLRQLRRVLGTISDQPITLHIDGLKIEIQYITI